MNKELIIKELNDLSFRLLQPGIEMTRQDVSKEVSRISKEVETVNSFPDKFDLAFLEFINRYYENLDKMTRTSVNIYLMPNNGYNKDCAVTDIEAIQSDLRKAIIELGNKLP